MSEPPDPETGEFEHVLSAIVDGRPVDWEAVARTPQGRSARDVLAQLQVLERVCSLHGAEAAGTVAAWGHLALLRPVGSGTSADVFRAWDTRLDREVALKLLRRRVESAADASSVLAEARALARIRHPNVATVYGADVIDGQVGLWMELVRGRTLEAILKEQGPFGPREAALIGLDLCRALAALHGLGLLHRDVKTQNVVREDGGRIVLMDLGSAHSGARPVEVVGTPLYIAPEVLGGGAATPGSDLYGVGVVLFRLVTGAFPVAGATMAEIAAGHLAGSRTWLRDLRPDVTDRFADVVERALLPDAARRFSSAGQMEQALRLVVGEGDQTGARADAVGSVPPSHRVPRVVLAVVTVLVVAGGLLVGSLTGLRGGQPGGAGTALSPLVLLSPHASRSMLTRQAEEPWAFLVHGRPSADGRWFSFPQGPGDLALFDFARGRSSALTDVRETDEEASYSVPSRDGTAIAYMWRALDGGSELRVIDRQGLHPRVVLRDPALQSVRPFDWSADGRSVLVSTVENTNRRRLLMVDVMSRHVRPLLDVPATPTRAAFSPDGRLVAFDAPQTPSTTSRAIRVLDVATGIVRPGTSDSRADCNPMWVANGDLVFFSRRLGLPSLWLQRFRDGEPDGPPSMLGRDFAPVVGLGLSDAGTLFYAEQSRQRTLYTATRDRRHGGWAAPVPLPGASAALAMSPSWSPDGNQLAYVTVASFTTDGDDPFTRSILILDRRTNRSRELVLPFRLVSRPLWSPDGARLLVSFEHAAGAWRVASIDAATGAVVGRSAAEFEDGPPDVGWAEDGSGVRSFIRGTLMSCDLAGGACAPDPSAPALAGATLEEPGLPAFGRDGAIAAVFDLAPGEQEVRIADPGRQWRPVARVSGERVTALSWSAGEELFVARCRRGGESCALWSLDPITGRTAPANISLPGLGDVAADAHGEALAFVAGEFRWDIWLLRDFLPR